MPKAPSKLSLVEGPPQVEVAAVRVVPAGSPMDRVAACAKPSYMSNLGP